MPPLEREHDRQPLEPEVSVEGPVTRFDEEFPSGGVGTGVATGFDYAASNDPSNDEGDKRTTIDLTECSCVVPDLEVEKDEVGDWHIQIVYCGGCERELATLTESPDAVGCNNFPE